MRIERSVYRVDFRAFQKYFEAIYLVTKYTVAFENFAV
jgi:hypothetical protein